MANSVFTIQRCFEASRLALVLLLQIGYHPAQATSFAPQAFPKTVYDAPVIVKGKIGMSYADWGADTTGAKRIYTFYELQIGEVLKGSVEGNSLTMREFGGTAGGIGMEIPGASQYQRGELVVVFLRDKNPDGTFDVQGMMMGKLNIDVNSDGEEILSGPALMENEQAHTVSPARHAGTKWTLSELRKLIADQKSGAQSPPQTPAPPDPASYSQNPSAAQQSRVSALAPKNTPQEFQYAGALKSFLVGFMVFMGARLRRSLRSKT